MSDWRIALGVLVFSHLVADQDGVEFPHPDEAFYPDPRLPSLVSQVIEPDISILGVQLSE